MPTRCARCGSLAGRGRDVQLPGEWVAFLKRERDLPPPVGRLSMPLCRDCVSTADDLLESDASTDEPDEFLEALDLDLLVDSGA